VRLSRILLLAALALVAAIVVVPGAVAGNFDEQRMGCAGEDPAICPTGTTGQPYSIPIELLGDEDEQCAVYSVSSGSLPPGIGINSDRISGTPTQAGTYNFFLTVTYNREASCPFKNPSDDPFRISEEKEETPGEDEKRESEETTDSQRPDGAEDERDADEGPARRINSHKRRSRMSLSLE